MANQFCNECRPVLDLYSGPRQYWEDGQWPESFRLYTSHDFEQTAKNKQCELCILIFSECSTEVSETIRSRYVEDKMEQGHDRKYKTYFYWQFSALGTLLCVGLSSSPESDEETWEETWAIHDPKELEFTVFKTPRLPQPRQLSYNTGHLASLNAVKYWLTDCSNHHVSCEPQASLDRILPSRLVYIGQQNQILLRLRKDFPPGTKYATLSHRWALDPEIELRKANIDSFMHHLPRKRLPKKFLDAIKITKFLGLDYIWIDSLCIIQDSESDWYAESAVMGQIYLFAHINIAGTTGTPAGSGLFGNRDPRRLDPYIMWNDRGTKRNLGIISHRYWFNAVDAAPLDDRGWVFQERYLSPRTMHFCDNQIFWECSTLDACEAFPDGVPVITPNPKKIILQVRALQNEADSEGWTARRIKDQFGQESISRTGPLPLSSYGTLEEQWKKAYPAALRLTSDWTYLVTQYSFKDLTVSTDKLIAISALAWYWQAAKGVKVQYLAGLWRDNLVTQLMWRANRLATLQDTWRAPTWSWACIDGHVSFPEVYMESPEDVEEILIVLGADIELVSEDPFGSVRKGTLTLLGRLARVSVRSNMKDPTAAKSPRRGCTLMVDLESLVDIEAKTYPNSLKAQPCPSTIKDLYLMPARATESQWWGKWHPDRMVEALILRRQNNTKDTFERWGMCHMAESVYNEHFDEAFLDFDLDAEHSGLTHERGEDGIMRYKVYVV